MHSAAWRSKMFSRTSTARRRSVVGDGSLELNAACLGHFGTLENSLARGTPIVKPAFGCFDLVDRITTFIYHLADSAESAKKFCNPPAFLLLGFDQLHGPLLKLFARRSASFVRWVTCCLGVIVSCSSDCSNFYVSVRASASSPAVYSAHRDRFGTLRRPAG